MELNKISELVEIKISNVMFSEKELHTILCFALMIIGNHFECASKDYGKVAEILHEKGLITKQN